MKQIISGNLFAAIKGYQADCEYYVVMCPLKRLQKIFTFDEGLLAVENRAQRTINLSRIPEITNYILSRRNEYVFSSITACISGGCEFHAIGESGQEKKIGTLVIDEDADVFITDGQHRNAAIREALIQDSSLSNETISVVFFIDKSLEDRQRIFKDLNLYPVKTDRSLSITYDDSPSAKLSKSVIFNSEVLTKLVHMEESNLGPRSKKLFSHSAFNKANGELFKEITEDNYKGLIEKASEFWTSISKNLTFWDFVFKDKISAGEVRQDSIQAHSVTLQAIGLVGSQLLNESKNWKSKLRKLKNINWEKSNVTDWEGRCVHLGRMRNSKLNVVLTSIRIKQLIGLDLSDEEVSQEKQFQECKNAN